MVCTLVVKTSNAVGIYFNKQKVSPIKPDFLFVYGYRIARASRIYLAELAFAGSISVVAVGAFAEATL